MKLKIILSLAFLGFSTLGFASKSIVETLIVKENQEIVVKLQFADDIHVIPVNGNELKIEGEIEVNDGDNDDAYTVDVSSSHSTVKIQSKLDKSRDIYRVVQHLDKNGNVTSSHQTVQISGYFKLYVPKGRKVDIETINANLNLQDNESEMSAETINGEIDLALEKNANIDLNLSTINGDCYTNLDLKPVGKGIDHKGYGGSKADVRLNEGGRPIFLKTINGMMYLREK